MKKILIKQYTEGRTAVSYIAGKKCQIELLQYLDQGERIELDFSGIDYAITAFLNPIISDVILDKGAGIMQYIEIKNASESIINKIDLIKEGRLLKREDLIE